MRLVERCHPIQRTWHAGPHFTHEECLFLNLENEDLHQYDGFSGRKPAARVQNCGMSFRGGIAYV